MPFFLAGLALVATPGPATLTIAATSAAFGPLQAVRVVIGLITSMTLIAALTAGGIAALVLSVPASYRSVRLLPSPICFTSRIGSPPLPYYVMI